MAANPSSRFSDYHDLLRMASRWLVDHPGWSLLGFLLVAVTVTVPVGLRRCQSEWLFSGREFQEVDLANMEAAWARAGLTSYRIESQRVRIPCHERAQYVRALDDRAALPRRAGETLESALASTHPFESPGQRDARLQFAREQEISAVIRSMPEIAEATVRFDERTVSGLRPSVEARAAVIVHPHRGQCLLPGRIAAIRQLVAACRAGLVPGDVTVVDVPAGQTFDGKTHPTPGQLAYFQTSFQTHWNAQIRRQLETIPNVSVVSDIRLDPHDAHPLFAQFSITLPPQYYSAEWDDALGRRGEHARHPTVAEWNELQQEIAARIRARIEAFIPSTGYPETTYQVAVGPEAPDSPPTTMDSTWQASQIWTVVAVVVLGCGGLMVSMAFFRDLKSTSAQRFTRSAAPASSREPPADAALPTARDPRQAPRSREELNELVRANPEAAAAALRSWMDAA